VICAALESTLKVQFIINTYLDIITIKKVLKGASKGGRTKTKIVVS